MNDNKSGLEKLLNYIVELHPLIKSRKISTGMAFDWVENKANELLKEEQSQKQPATCSLCKRTGIVPDGEYQTQKCPECEGNGYIEQSQKQQYRIGFDPACNNGDIQVHYLIFTGETKEELFEQAKKYLEEKQQAPAWLIDNLKCLANGLLTLSHQKAIGVNILELISHYEPQESLAELADRKGYDISAIGHWGTWVIELWNHKHEGLRHNDIGETYQDAESKARAYLNGLPDAKKEN